MVRPRHRHLARDTVDHTLTPLRFGVMINPSESGLAVASRTRTRRSEDCPRLCQFVAMLIALAAAAADIVVQATTTRPQLSRPAKTQLHQPTRRPPSLIHFEPRSRFFALHHIPFSFHPFHLSLTKRLPPARQVSVLVVPSTISRTALPHQRTEALPDLAAKGMGRRRKRARSMGQGDSRDDAAGFGIYLRMSHAHGDRRFEDEEHTAVAVMLLFLSSM